MNWINDNLPAWNSCLALLLYWLPLLLCAYGYTVRAVKEYREDVARSAREIYIPGLTIGTLVGYALTTVVPMANLFAAIFSIGPDVFNGFFRWCGKVLDVPLVPKRARKESGNA